MRELDPPRRLGDDAAQLADFVRRLGDFQMYATIGEPYDHIGATVADAILQANRRYTSFVAPRVQRIRDQYSAQRTTAAIVDMLRVVPIAEFLRLHDLARAARFEAVLALLVREGVDTEAELREWLVSSDGATKLRAIPGVGPKTADYFKILVGLPESAIDRHLDGFLLKAEIGPIGYAAAQATINAAADLLGVGRALFDHSIWQNMSRRARRGHAESDSAAQDGLVCHGTDVRYVGHLSRREHS